MANVPDWMIWDIERRDRERREIEEENERRREVPLLDPDFDRVDDVVDEIRKQHIVLDLF